MTAFVLSAVDISAIVNISRCSVTGLKSTVEYKDSPGLATALTQSLTGYSANVT